MIVLIAGEDIVIISAVGLLYFTTYATNQLCWRDASPLSETVERSD
jgi:hypothetical protein